MAAKRKPPKKAPDFGNIPVVECPTWNNVPLEIWKKYASKKPIVRQSKRRKKK